MTKNAYLDTIARMEPDIAAVDLTAAAASIAISLRRIADAQERIARATELATFAELAHPSRGRAKFESIKELDKLVDGFVETLVRNNG